MQGVLPFLEEKKFMVLDGGFATALELHDININEKNVLWGVNQPLDNPETCKLVHR